jgi:hypothetical protein
MSEKKRCAVCQLFLRALIFTLGVLTGIIGTVVFL